MSANASFLIRNFRTASQEDRFSGSAGSTSCDLRDPTRTMGYIHRDDRKLPSDPQLEHDIVDSISEEYYQPEDEFDAGEHELKKLTSKGSIDMHHLELIMQQMKRQLQVVSKKMSYQILEKQPGYVKELGRVQNLQQDLYGALRVCRDGRSHLEVAKHCNTESVLELFSFYRRKCNNSTVLKCLGHITTLQRTDLMIQRMLEEGDFPGAVQLCLECRQVAVSYRQYTCISQLSSKLSDTLVMIEEQLDRALASICDSFQPAVYMRIQMAFKMIGKTQSCLDQLKMHYSSLLHNKCFSLVLGYAVLNPDTNLSESQFQRMQYPELCSHVSPQLFTACLSDLSQTVWQILHSYFQMCNWHDENMSMFQDSAASPAESGHIVSFFTKKLHHDRNRMWQEVQTKVKTFLQSIDICQNFGSFSFDEFIKTLDMVDKLTDVGKQFCQSPSVDLQECIKQQSAAYFKIYHRSCMSDLKLFLETDVWEFCPIKHDFKLSDLHDFHFLEKSKTEENKEKESASYFLPDSENPFSLTANQAGKKQENILAGVDEEGIVEVASDSDDDIAPELRADYIDEISGEVFVRCGSSGLVALNGGSQNGVQRRSTFGSSSHRRSYGRQLSTTKVPLITNTTLSVLRYFGKYVQMMSLLKPVAFDVLICMSQLFDYYLFTVHDMFVFKDTNPKMYSHKLKTLLERIRNNLILSNATTSAHLMPSSNPPGGVSPSANLPHSLSSQTPSPAVEKEKFPPVETPLDLLQDANHNLFSLSKRMIACESVVFLAQQFENLRPHLQTSIHQSKVTFLNQFLVQTMGTCGDLRVPVYHGVASRVIDYASLIAQMGQVKWDLKEITSQQSPYVEFILSQFKALKQKLAALSRDVPFNKTALQMLLEQCLKLTSWAFIEGYSNVKKCTNEGRALMQLDFQIYLVEISKITEIHPVPDQHFVETFIKAFYLPEIEFEKWVSEHREFSAKQLLSIINSAGSLQVNKKLRQKLQSVIEDQEKQNPQFQTNSSVMLNQISHSR